MATKLTIPVSNTWNAAPTVFHAVSGRSHCVYWYDDGAGNEGLWHTYIDDFSVGWQTGQALTTNAPGPQAGASFAGVIQNEADRLIVYFGDDANGDLYETHSDDDGATWSVPALFLATIKSGSLVPQVIVIKADSGRWIFAVVYDNAGGGAPYDVYTFYSDDEGATLSTPIIHHVAPNDPQVTLYQLRYGKVVLATVDATGANMRMIRSRDRGETWEDIVVVYDNTGFEAHPSLVQLFTDEILCAFDTNEGGTDDIKLVRSSDKGFNWGTKTTVYSSGGSDRYPTLVDYTRDDLLCAFQSAGDIKMVSSGDGGATWGSFVTLTPGAGTHSSPHMIRLSNGDILCVYITLLGPNRTIQMVRSTDQGATWGSSQTIFTPTPLTAGLQEPYIFETADNDLLCTYTDTTANQNELIKSEDGGATWTTTPTIIFIPPTGTAGQAAIYEISEGVLGCVVTPNNTMYLITSSDDGANWGYIEYIFASGSSIMLPHVIQIEGGRFICAYTQYNGGSDFDVHAIHSPDGLTWELNTIPLANVSKALAGEQLPNGDNLMWLYDTVLGEPVVMTGYDEDALEWDTASNQIVGVRYVDGAPTVGIHNAMLYSFVLYVYTDWGGASSALYSLMAESDADVVVLDSLESIYGMEAPQIVVTWDNIAAVQATDTDGVTNIGVDAYNFNSANATFTSDVEVGDRLVIENAVPSAVDGTYVIIEVTDDSNLKILTAFGASVGSLAYQIVSDLPDVVEIRRKEFEYPIDRQDGNFCALYDPASLQDDPYYSDPGEEVLTGTDGATVNPNIFNSPTGGFSGVVNVGDELQITDTGDIRNNDIYIVIEVTDDNNLKVDRAFAVAAIGSLDFNVWTGPRPFGTYYYSIFTERVKPDSLFGRERSVYRTWCFAGGEDNSEIYPTFKTRLYEMMPKVYRDRDDYKLTSTPDQAIEYGEVIYREEANYIAGHLERLSRLGGLFLQRAQDLIDNYPAAWALRTAPPPVLIALGDMLGQELNQKVQAMPISRWRKYVHILPLIFQRRGTVDSINRTARFYGYERGVDDIIYPLARAHLDTAEVVASGTAGVTTNPNIFSDVGGGFSGVSDDWWLWILDDVDERDNSVYQIDAVVNDTTILLDQNFPVVGLSGLKWTVFSEIPFDRTTFDSFAANWDALLLFALYRDGVYQLWSEPDTQFVFEEIRKVSPFNLTLTYNEEVP